MVLLRRRARRANFSASTAPKPSPPILSTRHRTHRCLGPARNELISPTDQLPAPEPFGRDSVQNAPAIKLQWTRASGFDNPLARAIMAVSPAFYLLRVSHFPAGKECLTGTSLHRYFVTLTTR